MARQRGGVLVQAGLLHSRATSHKIVWSLVVKAKVSIAPSKILCSVPYFPLYSVKSLPAPSTAIVGDGH